MTVTSTTGWGAEQVHGSPLADKITGSTGRDMILGGDGDDTLTAAGSDVTANGDPGDPFNKALADVLAGMGGDDALVGVDGNAEVFAVHAGMGDDTISTFTLKEDHLHFLDAGEQPSCVLAAATNTVICTLGSQTVTITHTGTPALTDPLDLAGDLNIVVVPPAGS